MFLLLFEMLHLITSPSSPEIPWFLRYCVSSYCRSVHILFYACSINSLLQLAEDWVKQDVDFGKGLKRNEITMKFIHWNEFGFKSFFLCPSIVTWTQFCWCYVNVVQAYRFSIGSTYWDIICYFTLGTAHLLPKPEELLFCSLKFLRS